VDECVLAVTPLSLSAAAAASHSATLAGAEMQLPDVCCAKPSYCPAGHCGHEAADAALHRPAGHAEHLVPVCSMNVPGVHAVQVAATPLVLPVGPTVPAAQAVPLHA
jgi:hypothetical protein